MIIFRRRRRRFDWLSIYIYVDYKRYSGSFVYRTSYVRYFVVGSVSPCLLAVARKTRHTVGYTRTSYENGEIRRPYYCLAQNEPGGIWTRDCGAYASGFQCSAVTERVVVTKQNARTYSTTVQRPRDGSGEFRVFSTIIRFTERV